MNASPDIATATAATAAATPSDPWAALTPSDDGAAAADDWLSAPADSLDGASAALSAPGDSGFALHQLWDGSLPIEAWINQGLAWVVDHFRPFFQTVRGPIDTTLTGVESLLLSTPSWAMIALMGLLAWQFAGRAIAAVTVVSLLLVAMLGVWPQAMVTMTPGTLPMPNSITTGTK